MTAAADILEQRLTDAYARQMECYDRALAIVGQAARLPEGAKASEPLAPRIVAQQDANAEYDAWVVDLQTVLSEIADLESQMASDKSLWSKTGRSPGARLGGILDDTAERIRTLTTLIDRRVDELKARRQRWLPDLDEFIRQKQMLQSYAQYGKPLRVDS